MIAASTGNALVLAELGAIILGLAVLARFSARLGITAIPFYLLGGLAFGEGGLVPLDLSEEFVVVGSEIGVVLLLLALGLEYTAEDLALTLRTSLVSGVADLVLNFTPGFAAGLLLGWGTTTAVLLGGVTAISSSGVVAKTLSDLGRMGNRETPAILGILVMEDLAMAVFLPLVGVLLAPEGSGGFLAVLIAVVTVVVVLAGAMRFSHVVSRFATSQSDEGLLLTVVGLTLLVAGIAQELQVSSAVGAFLVGIALSGPVSERASELISPLRDLFAATFFLFFGLQVDPASLPAVLPVALVLAVVTSATKVAAGRLAAARLGVGPVGRWRAGVTLIARGEFSIVIAGLGVAAAGVHPDLGATAAAYVLLLAATGPILAKVWPRTPAGAVGHGPAPHPP
ncbi:MAG TPA: cation:proton antiporter [Acidimicrobiales bacterium]|nr:cation:proton antiporter [Acidimicrobiales bacterium]